MRSPRATHNLIAVSANLKETALNTPQTLDSSLLVGLSDVINLDPRRETDASELNGHEEASSIYDNGATSSTTFNFPKAQTQHFGFVCAYALGTVSTATVGAGYTHTITPIANDLDSSRSNPSFAAAQRWGLTVAKRLFSSMFVDSFTATFTKDDWIKLAAQIKGTGKYSDSVLEETITALDNVTSLTLAANAVAGSTAAARLDSIHQIRAETAAGVWEEVEFSAVSSATPAVLTITSTGGAGASISYKVLYVPTEAAWATFPSRITESALRISDLQVTLGGKWSGSAFEGGKALTAEINSLEWNFQNSLAIEFTPGTGYSGYASRAFREGRGQTVKLDREFRNFILQQAIASNETFGLRILCNGAEFADGENYKVEIIFPKLGVLKAPISVSGKRLAEAGDLQVLEDSTYGSVIVKVTNQVATYAA